MGYSVFTGISAEEHNQIMTMKTKFKYNFISLFPYFLISLFPLFIGCDSGNNPPLDSPTSGEINIGIDETFSQVMDSEVYTFNSLYKYAKVIPHYVSEKQAFTDLLENKARLIIVSRELNADEKKVFQDIKIAPRVLKVAKDALAFIVNKDNSDTSLTFAQLKEVMKGKIRKWKEINPKSSLTLPSFLITPVRGQQGISKKKSITTNHFPIIAMLSIPMILWWIISLNIKTPSV